MFSHFVHHRRLLSAGMRCPSRKPSVVHLANSSISFDSPCLTMQRRWMSIQESGSESDIDGSDQSAFKVAGMPVKPPRLVNHSHDDAHQPIPEPGLEDRAWRTALDDEGQSIRRVNFPDFVHNWTPTKFRNIGVGGAVATAGLCAFSGLNPVFLAPWAAYGWIGYRDMNSQSAIRRNYPVLGNFRYFCETIRPEIQQYFIETEHSGKPFSREQRSFVYRRAKNQDDTSAFGTQRDVYEVGHAWLDHSLWPTHCKKDRKLIGGNRCSQPYQATRLNISAMSYGALSKNAVLALNLGAKAANCYHNTGEGGVSPYHLKGGADIVWNVGTGYFGCRDEYGDFDPILFSKRAAHPNIKMIEVKISQGAKPGHGGMLPASKITDEIAAIRHIPKGKDCMSPPSHSAFGSPRELMKFCKQLRQLSGGKPVGIKICMGRPVEMMAILRAAAEGCKDGEIPDFITVDGAEGGTGAAPNSFVNRVGCPLQEALALVVDGLRGLGIRKEIAVIVSGRVLSGFDGARMISMGADMINSARGMMFALGCIQALRCNSNQCPTGITTNVPRLENGLVVAEKWKRVYYYQKRVSHDLRDMMGAAGCQSLADAHRDLVRMRLSQTEVKSFEEIWPTVPVGCLVGKKPTPECPRDLIRLYEEAETLMDRNAIGGDYSVVETEFTKAGPMDYDMFSSPK